MNFNTFFDHIEASELTINIDSTLQTKEHLLNNEALFQLPLISLIILLMAKDKRKPYVSEIGQLVGESIQHSMAGFKGTSLFLGWSANLRIRTVTAISFLDYANLIEIENSKGRVKITKLGKKVIDRALEKDDNLSYNLILIARNYRHICVSKQFDMEL